MWKESTANIVKLLAGFEKGKRGQEFEAYCAAYRSVVMQSIFERQFCSKLHISRRHVYDPDIRDPQVRAAMSVAAAGAEKRLPKYFDTVRGLLYSYFEHWFSCRKNTWFLMTEDQPVLGHTVERLLKSARPYIRWDRRNSSKPGEFQFPTITSFTLSIGRPDLEAVRLFLIVLTSRDLKRIKRCAWIKCANFFCGGKKFCSGPCRQKSFADDDAFRVKRKRIMRKRRADDIEQVIGWAAESMLDGEKLVKKLNDCLAKKRVENGTIDEITINWITRHWKEIEQRRKLDHAKFFPRSIKQAIR